MAPALPSVSCERNVETVKSAAAPDRTADPPAAPVDVPTIPLTKPSMGPDELAAVEAVLDSGWLAGQGPRGTALEAAFCELTGRGHAIAVNNCTAGLHLALRGLGVGPGDEVLVADYTFPATAHAVLYCGATPVFVDVRPDTGTLDPGLLEVAVTERTVGVVGVDALGMPADWSELERITRSRGLFLVEDAACSAGGRYQGRACGAFGEVAVFSLHARKGVTCGEGGVVVTDDARLAAQVRSETAFGMQSAFARQGSSALPIGTFADLGYNYKLSDVLAAIAVVQLGRLDGFVRRRREIAARYAELLAGLPHLDVPVVPADREPTWQTYAVSVRAPLDRDAVAMRLRSRGIGATIGTYALHREPLYASPARCPVSAGMFAQHLALPMFPELTDADQDRVVAEVGAALAG
jgi:perosamine synthetase